MRGVMVFMTALFALGPYYIIMTMVFDPMAAVILDFDLTVINGAASINTLKNILYLWGPMVYIAGWFLWSVRYYMSRSLFLGRQRSPR